MRLPVPSGYCVSNCTVVLLVKTLQVLIYRSNVVIPEKISYLRFFLNLFLHVHLYFIVYLCGVLFSSHKMESELSMYVK